MQTRIQQAWRSFTKGKEKLLNPPATKTEIVDVEKQLNFKIPESLKSIYLLVDG